MRVWLLPDYSSCYCLTLRLMFTACLPFAVTHEITAELKRWPLGFASALNCLVSTRLDVGHAVRLYHHHHPIGVPGCCRVGD